MANKLFQFSVPKPPPETALLLIQSKPLHLLYHQTRNKTNLVMFRVEVSKQMLEAYLQIYQWRYSTQFPIVKTKYLNIVKNPDCMKRDIEIQVFIQNCPLKLNYIYGMSPEQSLYLLKQSVIGFQRLFSRFGGFRVTDSMVAVNDRGMCRVWFNDIFAINQFKSSETQKSMIEQIVSLMEIHSKESKVLRTIFCRLKDSGTFLETIKRINAQVALLRIILPQRFELSKPCKPISHCQLKPKYNHRHFPISLSTISLKYGDSNIKEGHFLSKSSQTPVKQNRKKIQSRAKLAAASKMKNSLGQTAYSSNQFGAQSIHEGLGHPQSSADVVKNRSPKFWPKKAETRVKGFPCSLRLKTEQDNMKQSMKGRKNSGSCQPQFRLIRSKSNQTCVSYSSFRKTNMAKAISDDAHCPSKPCSTSQQFTKNNALWITQFTSEEDQQIKKHTEIISMNNGWSISNDILQNSPKQLFSSFHDGKQQTTNDVLNCMELKTLGRQKIATSVLFDEYGHRN